MMFLSKNLSDTSNLARDFLLKVAKLKNGSQSLVVGLYGDLGSGKTTFVQFLARELGIKENITSPTFVIEKIYPIQIDFPYKNLIHIDCYRINDPAEMTVLRWDETLANPDNLIVTEWPERIKNLLPRNRLEIKFKFIDENTREIEF